MGSKETFWFFSLLLILFAVVFVIRIIAEHRTRRLMIEKGMLDDDTESIFRIRDQAASRIRPPVTYMKWVLLLIAVGGSLIFNDRNPRALNSNGEIGLTLILSGVAVYVYYLYVRRELRKERTAASEADKKE